MPRWRTRKSARRRRRRRERRQVEGDSDAQDAQGFPAARDEPRPARGRRRIAEETGMSSEWPLWEVFIRSQHGLAHKHVGSLHAADAGMAIKNARDVYTRRNEGVSIWAVRSSDIAASSPGDKEPLFEPANSKVYRHPTFFPMPDEVKHI
jgi:ring-1,2-phenylacetyl-CoA epoxidase subunit PaaB